MRGERDKAGGQSAVSQCHLSPHLTSHPKKGISVLDLATTRLSSPQQSLAGRKKAYGERAGGVWRQGGEEVKCMKAARTTEQEQGEEEQGEEERG